MYCGHVRFLAPIPPEAEPEALLWGGKWEVAIPGGDAEAVASGSSDTLPAAIKPYLERGNKLLSHDDYDKAIAEYTKAVELAPENPAAYVHRGRAFSRKAADPDRPIRFDDIVVGPGGYSGRDEMDRRAARAIYVRAIADFNRAIELNPKYVAAYTDRASTYSMMAYGVAESREERSELYDKCIADYATAARLDPEEEAWRRNVASTKEKKRLLTEAFW